MNEVIKAMLERRSCRKFKKDAVPRELIEQIVEAGLWAASGKGAQAPIMIVVTDPELRDRIAEANRKIGGWKEGFDPFYGAPVIIAVLSSKEVPTYVYDGSLTMGNLMLAAHSVGLGSIWIHRAKQEFETPEFRAILDDLGLEGEYEGIGHCAIGYPDIRLNRGAARKDDRVFWME